MPHLDSVTIRTALPSDAREIAETHLKGWQQSYKGLIEQNYLDSLSNDLEARSNRWEKIISS